MGGSAYSSFVAKHKYATPPPRKIGKIKRNMGDQFCTIKTCSERLEPRKRDGGWSLELAVNSGESRNVAPEKYVPVYVRKEQLPQGEHSDLGQACNRAHVVPAGKVLSEDLAAKALQRLAASKLKKAEGIRERHERDRFQAQCRKNAAEKLSKRVVSHFDAMLRSHGM